MIITEDLNVASNEALITPEKLKDASILSVRMLTLK